MSGGLAADSVPADRGPGLQPERTRLAWLRTILAMTVAAVLAARTALLGLAGAGAVLVTGCVILSWLGFVAVAHQRMHTLSAPQPPRLTHRAALLAAAWISDAQLAEVRRHLDAMREARDDVEQLNAHDAAFHRAVVSATGNETLLTVLEGISGRTLCARIWRGLVDDKAGGRTLAEHEAIFNALSTRDAALSQAAALLHVSNTEQWLREHLRSDEPLPSGTAVRQHMG